MRMHYIFFFFFLFPSVLVLLPHESYMTINHIIKHIIFINKVIKQTSSPLYHS